MPDSKIPATGSFKESQGAAQSRVHPLKHCANCGADADPRGGVDMRDKWYCAKCWIKFLNRK